MTPEEREREKRWREYNEKMNKIHERFKKRLFWGLVTFLPMNAILISINADGITSLLVGALVGLAIIIATS